MWDLSSAGRASALQAEGHRFEPYRSHLYEKFHIDHGGIAQLARAHGSYPWCREFKSPFRYYGGIAQLARAHGSYPWCREFKSPFRYDWKSRESEKNPGIFFDHNNFSEIFCCTKTGKNIRNDLADIRGALSVPGFSLKRFPVILLQDNIRPRTMLNLR